jgi:TrmH family RNA methyltransferase
MPSRREQKELRALRQRRTREAEGRFLAEGLRTVEDLLDSPLTIRLVVVSSSLEDTDRGLGLRKSLEDRGIPLRAVTEGELRDLAATETPQGIVAIADIPRASLGSLVPGSDPASSPSAGRPSSTPTDPADSAGRSDPPSADRRSCQGATAVILVMDAVQDPGNFGTLVRTAEALGAAGVVALPGTVDPWNPKTVRAAMGSSFRLPIVEAGWDELEPWLREGGFAILAADAGGEPLPTDPPDRAALVLGNEGAGVGAETLRRADRTVAGPIRGRAESLNVAAAGAILLYELLR